MVAAPAASASAGRSTSSKESDMVENRKELAFFIAVGGLIVVAVVAVITRFV
jgi:hypothetical protein